MFGLLVLVAIIIAVLLFMKSRQNNLEVYNVNEKLPYVIRDDFLSDAERSFYFTLNSTIFKDNKFTLCPKVSLKDIFFVKADKGEIAYFNKIARKHIDFLLCETKTMKPICGIELDDTSHSRHNRVKRDEFVEKVFADAGLNLVRIKNKNAYTYEELLNEFKFLFYPTPNIQEINNEEINKNIEPENQITEQTDAPLCKKCGVQMILRKAQKGENAGKSFYGCPNYPKCKEIINL